MDTARVPQELAGRIGGVSTFFKEGKKKEIFLLGRFIGSFF
jgi:hypothetical protein